MPKKTVIHLNKNISAGGATSQSMRSVQDKSIELISSHKENQVDTDQADTVEASQKTLKI